MVQIDISNCLGFECVWPVEPGGDSRLMRFAASSRVSISKCSMECRAAGAFIIVDSTVSLAYGIRCFDADLPCLLASSLTALVIETSKLSVENGDGL